MQANEGLTGGDEIACGGYDEAIGERCDSLIYYRRISALLSENASNSVVIAVPKGHISRAAGHKKENKTRIYAQFGIKDIKFIEKDLPPYTAELITQ